ncbi:MAG: hypothetical protein GY699_06540 [Desulfobacteraceae bacterium]|nr:hypothetical protein [Desulfobacteraceae bacterium]
MNILRIIILLFRGNWAKGGIIQRSQKVSMQHNTHIRIYFIVLFLSLIFFFSGCGQNEKEGQEKVLKNAEKVLATVNGSPITVDDLELMAKRTHGKDYIKALDEKNKKTLLESLVFARAIAQKAQAELTKQDKAIIENKTNAFREELLIQIFLTQNIRPEPVSDKMIKEYYQSHLEQFGKKKMRQYEIIMTKSKIKTGQRKRMLSALDDATSKKNWEQWSKTLLNKGYPISFSAGTFRKDKLDQRLSKLILSLDSGEVSSPAFINERLYIVKVTHMDTVQPHPLEEVSASIKRKLAPLAVKKALKKAKEQVLKDAQVIYTN